MWVMYDSETEWNIHSQRMVLSLPSIGEGESVVRLNTCSIGLFLAEGALYYSSFFIFEFFCSTHRRASILSATICGVERGSAS